RARVQPPADPRRRPQGRREPRRPVPARGVDGQAEGHRDGQARRARGHADDGRLRLRPRVRPGRQREHHPGLDPLRRDGRVHATLAASVVEGHRLFTKPMESWEKEAMWRQWRDVGRLVGVRYRDLPEDWDGFEQYFADMVATTLQWTPAVDEVMDLLGSAPP